MFYFNVKSGSTGNSSLINFGKSYFLVDIGVSYKYLLSALAHINLDVKKIKCIFLTHEHVDHIKGLSTFIKFNPDIKVYCSKYTALKLLLDNFDLMDNIRIIRSNTKYKIGNMFVYALETHHDALESFGYIFYYNNFKMCYLTDLGTIINDYKKMMIPCDFIVLESNYDNTMLVNSQYPFLLKTRIKSLVGHLSNYQTSCFALELSMNGTKQIVLTHLSRTTNSIYKAYYSTFSKVKKYGTSVYVNRNFFQNKILLEV